MTDLQANLEFKPALSLNEPSFNPAKQREDTRSLIAKIFIFGYFGAVILLIILTALNRLNQDTVKDYLLAIGSPLGFVVGFYFKSTEV